MKRIISIVLVLLLGMMLFVPATASSTAPVITRHPVGGGTYTVDNTIVLDVQARLPAGSDGEMTVEWFHGNRRVATGRVGRIRVTQNMIPTGSLSNTIRITAVVTHTYIADGQVRTASTRSRAAEVRVVSCPQDATTGLWSGNGWRTLYMAPVFLVQTIGFFIGYGWFNIVNLFQQIF